MSDFLVLTDPNTLSPGDTVYVPQGKFPTNGEFHMVEPSPGTAREARRLVRVTFDDYVSSKDKAGKTFCALMVSFDGRAYNLPGTTSVYTKATPSPVLQLK